MKLIRSAPFPSLLLLSLVLPGGRAAAADEPAWLSDIAAARARSRAEKKPLFAVFR